MEQDDVQHDATDDRDTPYLRPVRRMNQPGAAAAAKPKDAKYLPGQMLFPFMLESPFLPDAK